ncbi:adenosylcobinamide amidohydrolase [Paenibacillus sp. GCM10023252]|uniref:adenosylcobinamide amidohydrolase n=1 Tax=Paenibacillus sp. GCM10023252 TaxID=3252649 RepID=UPI003612FA3C
MTLPFRTGNRVYQSEGWAGLTISLLEERIVLESPDTLRMLSSSVNLGGFAHGERVVNWEVPLSYRGTDPEEDMKSRLAEWGYSAERTVGLLTAAKLTHASILEEDGDCCHLISCTTAGTRNAARSGLPRPTFSAYRPGTINTIIAVNGAMTDSAMVNALITAVEAKSAALQDLGIVDPDNGLLATGTTTDAIVLAVSQRSELGVVHPYAGAATTIGNAIGRLVYETVYEAVRTQHDN